MRDLRRMSVTQQSSEARNSSLTAESEGEEKNAEQRTALEKRGRRGEMRADDSGDTRGGGEGS